MARAHHQRVTAPPTRKHQMIWILNLFLCFPAEAASPDRKALKEMRKPPSAEKVDAWLAEANLTRESKVSAILHTTHGEIPCELFVEHAPLTVANFVGLAEGTKAWKDPTTGEMTTRPLYANTIFHRVIRNFAIQGGDPTGEGKGNTGYRFENETTREVRFRDLGMLAMANAGPGTNSSQFFISLNQLPSLDGKHTIFGKCDPKIPVVISKLPTTNARTNEIVTLEKVEIKR